MSQEDALGSAFPVTQPVFTGPLHLLLTLLETQALDISEVSLMAVTSDYLQAIRDMSHLPPQSACAFIDVTTRLIALKARYLQPELAVDMTDDEESMSLVEQLEQLKAYNQVVTDLYIRQQDGTRTYRRHIALPTGSIADQSTLEAADRLTRALQGLMQFLPRVKPSTVIPVPLFTLDDVISRIEERVQAWPVRSSGHELSFFALLSPRSSRTEVVLTFLALLELVRIRTLRAFQEMPFGDITLQPSTPDESRFQSPLSSGTDQSPVDQ